MTAVRCYRASRATPELSRGKQAKGRTSASIQSAGRTDLPLDVSLPALFARVGVAEPLWRSDCRRAMRRTLVALAVAASLFACSDDSSSEADAVAPGPSVADAEASSPLPTLPPQVAGDQAQFEGILAWDDATGCVHGIAGAESTVLVFPNGYTARADPYAILNPDGEVVAREGDTVRLGGGYSSSDEGEVGGISVDPCPDGPVLLAWVLVES